MSDESSNPTLVACRGCGCTFAEFFAPSRCCPVCHHEGAQKRDSGVVVQGSWYSEMGVVNTFEGFDGGADE